MKIYEVNYQEVTIISKYVDVETISQLKPNQFVSEAEATQNLEQYIKDSK
jgi:hypothetical protein